MDLVLMEFGNLGSYKVLNTHVFFAYLVAVLEILSNLNLDF